MADEGTLRRFELDGWGVGLSVPSTWQRMGPAATQELLRVAAPPAGRPFLTVVNLLAADLTLERFVEWRSERILGSSGNHEIRERRPTTLGGAPAICVEYTTQSERTRGDQLWVSQYCVLRSPAVLVLSLYSRTPDDDQRTFADVVDSFAFT